MKEEAPPSSDPLHKARKVELTAWMRANNMKRQPLSEALGVSKGTLDNWFSSGFPEWGWKSIDRLMNPTGDLSAGLEVTFTASEFREIIEAMEIVGCSSLKTFYEEAIRNHVSDILKREDNSPQKRKATNITDFSSGDQSQQRVAEDPPKYRPEKNGTED